MFKIELVQSEKSGIVIFHYYDTKTGDSRHKTSEV